GRERGAVIGIIDRIRFGRSEDASVFDGWDAGETDASDFFPGQRDERRVAQIPKLVSGRAKILHPEASLAGVAGHVAAPAFIILNAADLDIRVVNIDPVVWKDVGTVHDETDDDETAKPKPARGLGDGKRRRRIESTDKFAERHARDKGR